MIDEKIFSTIGVLLNELIVNSIKHAFNETLCGIINFSFLKINGNIRIIFQDNGLGFPKSFSIDNCDNSFGMKLIKMLILKLNGSICISNDNGAKYVITFPI